MQTVGQSPTGSASYSTAIDARTSWSATQTRLAVRIVILQPIFFEYVLEDVTSAQSGRARAGEGGGTLSKVAITLEGGGVI